MVIKDRVKEITNTVGTGDYNLGATSVSSFNTFDSVLADGDQIPYCTVMGDEFETGLGTWNSGASTISRDIINTSSNGNSLVDWSTGSKEIFITAIADSYPTVRNGYPRASDNPTFIGKELINSSTGELFICIDNTSGLNKWQGQLGTFIKPIYIPTTAVLDSFSAPYSNPLGLAFDGTNLISCDSYSDLIYIHDGISDTILDSFTSPNSSPTGLTFDGTNLISCDSSSDTIYIHDGISNTILSSFAIPGSGTGGGYPRGVTFDGTNLISCDDYSNTIYVHDGVSSTILDSFSSPYSAPSDLTFDGTNLISCDSSSDTIYIHDGISSIILASISAPYNSPTGLTFDGTNLISCDSYSDRIYVHDREVYDPYAP